MDNDLAKVSELAMEQSYITARIVQLNKQASEQQRTQKVAAEEARKTLVQSAVDAVMNHRKLASSFRKDVQEMVSDHDRALQLIISLADAGNAIAVPSLAKSGSSLTPVAVSPKVSGPIDSRERIAAMVQEGSTKKALEILKKK